MACLNPPFSQGVGFGASQVYLKLSLKILIKMQNITPLLIQFPLVSRIQKALFSFLVLHASRIKTECAYATPFYTCSLRPIFLHQLGSVAFSVLLYVLVRFRWGLYSFFFCSLLFFSFNALYFPGFKVFYLSMYIIQQ